jgi:RNA polymerase sigma-70 factor (ECF subfamily)
LNSDHDLQAGRFRTTHWTAVLLCAQTQAPDCRAALEELCRIYWYPICAFIRRRGFSPEDAKDLTQGFFLHLLAHRALRKVSPVKGRFRSFLLASVQNYLSDVADRARCVKRGGNIEFVALDAEPVENLSGFGPVDFLTAEKIFDARWALTLMDEAMNRLHEEYAAQGKAAVFETLKVFLDPINSRTPLSYEQAANILQISIGSVKTLIHRLREQHAVQLRREVARTVNSPAEIDDEIHSLCEALIAAEGQFGP